MKKLLLALLQKYFDQITEIWAARLVPLLGEKLSESQLRTFAESSLDSIIKIIETNDYKTADQYLIDIYTLFSNANLHLLEISQLFSQGRFAILNFIEIEAAKETDPVILLGFFDELIEQLYARYGVLHQDTKMKELEWDRDRLARKLEFDQQYLKSILSNSDQAIMVVDKDENFIAWNKGAENIFGYTEQEILGKPSVTLFPEGEQFRKELENIIEETKRNGRISFVETTRKKKSGELLTVRLSVNRLPSKNSEYVGRMVIIKDHTEFKKLQAQIDQSEKLAVIGQLAAGVAHEIGNPLTSISSLVQILQRRLQY